MMILIEIERLAATGMFRVWYGVLCGANRIERQDLVLVEATAAPIEDAAKALMSSTAPHAVEDARLFVSARNGPGRTEVFSVGTVGFVSDGMRSAREVTDHNAMIERLA